MDGGKVTGMLFLDISKALDSIKHKILFGKLEHILQTDGNACAKMESQSETSPVDLDGHKGESTLE